jgi:hypothetical protein
MDSCTATVLSLHALPVHDSLRRRRCRRRRRPRSRTVPEGETDRPLMLLIECRSCWLQRSTGCTPSHWIWRRWQPRTLTAMSPNDSWRPLAASTTQFASFVTTSSRNPRWSCSRSWSQARPQNVDRRHRGAVGCDPLQRRVSTVRCARLSPMLPSAQSAEAAAKPHGNMARAEGPM